MDYRRIDGMERDFVEFEALIAALGDASSALKKAKEIRERLEEYQTSGRWLEDFEADERGEIPPDVKRGVLSEDGLYDAFEKYDEIIHNLKTLL